MTDSQICDRQGCLTQAFEMKTLPDGCLINVCTEHKPFFHNDPILGTHDAGMPGVYWHEHILISTPDLASPWDRFLDQPLINDS